MVTALLFYVVVAVVIALALVAWAPDLARGIWMWTSRLKAVFLLFIGLAVAYYFLTSGSILLIFLGILGVIIAVWALVFDDPFGWVTAITG